jgi:predicted nuclease of predicted toxin-antitoxin system
MEAGLAQAEDSGILDFALEEDRTCVTLDHDFHAHVAISRANGPSVVLVRVEGLNADRQAELIQRVWTSCGESIAAGAAISVDRLFIRVRSFPCVDVHRAQRFVRLVIRVGKIAALAPDRQNRNGAEARRAWQQNP